MTSTSRRTLLTDPPEDVVPQPTSLKILVKVPFIAHSPASRCFIISSILAIIIGVNMIIIVICIVIIIILTCDSGHPLIIVSSCSVRQTSWADVWIRGPVDLHLMIMIWNISSSDKMIIIVVILMFVQPALNNLNNDC